MKELLKNGFSELGINCDETAIERLSVYAEILKEKNKQFNLTKITDDTGICVKHFLDSASLLCAGKLGSTVIDVGTGAGFPGLVLKVLEPGIHLTLLDSLNKRINFLKEASVAMGLTDINFLHLRAEDGGRNKQLRESFDTVVSRAVASLPLLCELCIPFVRIGGYFLAMKGPAAEEELKNSKRAISILGGETETIKDVKIPFSDLSHKIVVIKKVRQTPTKFPRKPAYITKSPIETCYNVRKKPII